MFILYIIYYYRTEVPVKDEEIYNLLKEHLSNTIKWSAYNWVRPSLWSAMFQHKKEAGEDKKMKKI